MRNKRVCRWCHSLDTEAKKMDLYDTCPADEKVFKKKMNKSVMNVSFLLQPPGYLTVINSFHCYTAWTLKKHNTDLH